MKRMIHKQCGRLVRNKWVWNNPVQLKYQQFCSTTYCCERHYFVSLWLLLMIKIPKKNEFGYAGVSKTKVILKSFTCNTSPRTCYTSLGPRPNFFVVLSCICFEFLFISMTYRYRVNASNNLEYVFTSFTFFKSVAYFSYISDKMKKKS